MTSTYDVGVGRCCEVNSDLVVVKLDAVVVKKLLPDEPWRRSGVSVLRCDRKFCSDRRPPCVDQELFLDSAAISRHAPATLDLLGDGRFRKVDLKSILDGLKPLPAPPAGPKSFYPRRSK